MTLPRRPLPLAVVASLALAPLPAAQAVEPAAANGFETPWQPGANARARLLAAGGDGKLRAAIEIALEKEAHTYWRDPGDAGVPPRIAFEGSRNLKRAELRFPAPERIDEGGLKVIGYTKPVVLPIEVEAEDPAKPVHLAVQFSYAACAKICTPAEAATAIDLAPGQPPGPHAARLDAAAAALPERVGAGGPVDLTIEAGPTAADGKKRWIVRPRTPAAPWRDLFAEGPEGWFFETQAIEGGFKIIAADAPKPAQRPVAVRLTLAGARDYEIATELP